MSPKKVSLKGKTVGMMIMDPGITTGLAWGTFTIKGDSFYAMFKEGLKRTIDYNYGDEIANAEMAAEQWHECNAGWEEEDIDPALRFFVVEKWIPNIRKFSMDESFASALALTKVVQGMLYLVEPKYLFIQPSETHSVTNDQLRKYGLWITQKNRHGEHQLDVMKQGIQALRKMYNGLS
jgi:hypothetical protein